MKQDLIYTQTYKQTLHMTTGLKSHLEILSKDRQSLSDLLHEVSQNNPFLEYTPSQDIQQYLEAGISNKPRLKDELKKSIMKPLPIILSNPWIIMASLTMT